MAKRKAPSIDSDTDSDGFEEVTIEPIASTSKSKSKSKVLTKKQVKLPPTPIAPTIEDSDDEEEAWDEVDVNQDNRASTIAAVAAAALGDGLEIVIRGNGSKGKGKDKGKGKRKSTVATVEERMLRQQTHKTHVMALLAAGLVRNRSLNDELLMARLLSKCPLPIQNSFTAFNKTTHPNERDRSRLFDLALKELIHWWYQEFDIIDGTGIKRRLPREVEEELIDLGLIEPRVVPPEEGEGGEAANGLSKKKEVPKSNGRNKGKSKAKSVDFNSATEGQGEQVNSINSMMKCAIKMRGSKDMSAQLFTCLCRAIDIPARLIFSLQPFDWRAPSVIEKSNTRRKSKVTEDVSDEEVEARRGRASRRTNPGAGSSRVGSGVENESSDDGQPKLDYVVPAVNLRRTKIAKKPVGRSPSPTAVDRDAPPVFWTEVWTRSNRQWITVDVSRQAMRCKKAMEPAKGNIENQMIYVCAYEEDNSVRDITPRYAKTFNISTVKARVPSKKGSEDWFAGLIKPLARTFLLNRDRDELAELWDQKPNEPMPTSLNGFKEHPTYFLLQHLKRDEAILPGTKQLGLFRATEIVYPRSSVVPVKSAENYYRFGIVVKEGEEPMKMVKKRTVTINKKRAEAAALYDGMEVEQDALYAASQTELYVPPPIVDGKIPKNDFGNIDLFVPSMLPAGAVHLPNKGAAKCAKSLGIDYADAITGFEFRQRRATPTITGIVVAEEYAELLMEAIANTEEATLTKESEKLREKCLKSWKKLILGLRIRQRLQATYASKTALPVEGESQFSPAGKASTSKSATPAAIKAKAPALSNTSVTQVKSKSVAKPVPPPFNRSTSGQSLRFTMSAEKLEAAPQKKVEKVSEQKVEAPIKKVEVRAQKLATPEKKVDIKGKGKAVVDVSETEEEEMEVEPGGFELGERGDEDGDSDDSLEYESD